MYKSYSPRTRRKLLPLLAPWFSFWSKLTRASHFQQMWVVLGWIHGTLGAEAVLRDPDFSFRIWTCEYYVYSRNRTLLIARRASFYKMESSKEVAPNKVKKEWYFYVMSWALNSYFILWLSTLYLTTKIFLTDIKTPQVYRANLVFFMYDMICLILWNRRDISALASAIQWIEHWPANKGITGLIPSQGTCLGCGPGPQ